MERYLALRKDEVFSRPISQKASTLSLPLAGQPSIRFAKALCRRVHTATGSIHRYIGMNECVVRNTAENVDIRPYQALCWSWICRGT